MFHIIFKGVSKLLFKKEFELLKFRILLEKSQHSETSCPDHLQRLLLIAEDHRFYNHFGFDILAIIRASYNTLFLSKLEGASTVEQQLVRVLLNDYRITVTRKIKEIFLATTVKEIIPRTEIPSLYLKIAYYGWQMNGLEQAYKRLKIDSGSMTEDDLLSLIARIKYPEPQLLSLERQIKINRRKKYLKKKSLTYSSKNKYTG